MLDSLKSASIKYHGLKTGKKNTKTFPVGVVKMGLGEFFPFFLLLLNFQISHELYAYAPSKRGRAILSLTAN